jgi:hypothetical protein
MGVINDNKQGYHSVEGVEATVATGYSRRQRPASAVISLLDRLTDDGPLTVAKWSTTYNIPDRAIPASTSTHMSGDLAGTKTAQLRGAPLQLPTAAAEEV